MGLATGTHKRVKRKHQRRERPYVKAAAKEVFVHNERGDKPDLWCSNSTLEVDAARVSKSRVERVPRKSSGRHTHPCFDRPHLEPVGKLRKLIPTNRPPLELGPFISVVAITRQGLVTKRSRDPNGTDAWINRTKRCDRV